MAIIACLDGRDGARTSVFRDTVSENGVTSYERILVPCGKSMGVAEGLQKIVVTNDLVVVCCNYLSNVLT